MLTSILVFLLVLSILVLVHEFGHFWVAKKNGVWVEEFGFGLPPKVWGKKIGETIYSLNLLPFGGFVRLHGELTEDRVTDKKRAFIHKSKKAKTAVIVAGVVMNLLLAVVAFAFAYSHYGIPKETENVKVLDVVAGAPAKEAGILPGDIVRKVGETEVKTTGSFIDLVEKEKGKKINITLDNGKVVTVVPRKEPPAGEGPLGVVISNIESYHPPVWQMPFIGTYYGFKDSFAWGKIVFQGLGNIAQEASQGRVAKDVSGPIGIFAIIDQVVKQGDIWALINLVGIISINLAVLNILPFPALDGGRLLFIFVEGIFGRKVAPKIEAAIHTAGMVILLALILAITFKDVRALISAGSISGFLDSMIK